MRLMMQLAASPPRSPAFEIGLFALVLLLCLYLLRNRDRYMRRWFRRSPASADSSLVRRFIFGLIFICGIFAFVALVSAVVGLFR